MRGTVGLKLKLCSPLRITPAHAGNRAETKVRHCRHWDHPRTCGEQWCNRRSSRFRRGSPPHMRGTVLVYVSSRLKPGITPAHAGNRLKRSCISVLLGFIIYFFHSVYNRPDRRFHNPTKPCVPPDTIFQNAVTSLATCSFPYNEAFSWLVLRYQLSYL